ncbi:unnamed protein product [Lampetra planeri]
MAGRWCWLWLLLLLVTVQVQCQRMCVESDYRYQYTECDVTGGRWRVAVPHSPGACTGLPEPVKGTECSFSCGPGEFLQMLQQACERCRAGSYSLGDGVLFDEWDAVPPDFLNMAAMASVEDGPDTPVENCTHSGWTPNGAAIVSNQDECTASLVYAVNLKKPGELVFEYQYPDAGLFFEFFMQNDQCQSLTEEQEQKWMPRTDRGQWLEHRVALQVGNNVVYWRTTGYLLEKVPKPVMIRRIYITGVAYTSQCFPCRPGTFSEATGAASCKPCPRNTFSSKGAVSCTACNATTHYAEPGSSECKLRPPCTTRDYFEVHSPCDINHKTQLTYEWVEPKRCREDLAGAVPLPASGDMRPCPPCNPGFQSLNASLCTACPQGNFSNGTDACKSCPVGTESVAGLEYKWWNSLPDTMSSACYSIHYIKCEGKEAWTVGGDHIKSGIGNSDEDYLVLSLQVPFFRPSLVGYGEGGEVGTINFVFETICSSNCEFHFMVDKEKQRSHVVETWRGPHDKQSYTFSVATNGSFTFSWVFQANIDAAKDHRQTGSSARIYSINVTNAAGGGASYCRPCAVGAGVAGCVPCPPGHYVDAASRECMPCRDGTRLAARKPYGREACLACGPGTRSSKDHASCFSDCTYSHTSGERTYFFNYTGLGGQHDRRFGPSFSPKGTKYFYAFNFSLCGNEGQKMAECVDNVTAEAEETEGPARALPAGVRALACRATIVPSDVRSTTLSSQPIGLADSIIGVTTRESMDNISAPVGYFPESTVPDIPDIIHFYRSSDRTVACPQGRASTVRLRCNSDGPPNGEIVLPRQCPAGTCDGCTFHFLWLSPLACPLCTHRDYQLITETCSGGSEKLRYMWRRPRVCHGGEALPPDGHRKCELLGFWLRVGIGAGSFLACLLCSLTCYFWKKNRKLAYKYSRLVQSASSRESELPAADSCAIMEGEEEDVIYTNKDKSLFHKLMNMKATSPYEGNREERLALGKTELN